MKALLPVYCRLLGYCVIALGLFMPMVMAMLGRVTDANLLLYKECSKLLMMAGALMIIFAYTPNETHETEQIRGKAARNAIFLTFFILFGDMAYRVFTGDIMSVDTSSFLVYLMVHVLCLEFGIKKAAIGSVFKQKR